jgi:hypothetical protein
MKCRTNFCMDNPLRLLLSNPAKIKISSGSCPETISGLSCRRGRNVSKQFALQRRLLPVLRLIEAGPGCLRYRGNRENAERHTKRL